MDKAVPTLSQPIHSNDNSIVCKSNGGKKPNIQQPTASRQYSMKTNETFWDRAGANSQPQFSTRGKHHSPSGKFPESGEFQAEPEVTATSTTTTELKTYSEQVWSKVGNRVHLKKHLHLFGISYIKSIVLNLNLDKTTFQLLSVLVFSLIR